MTFSTFFSVFSCCIPLIWDERSTQSDREAFLRFTWGRSRLPPSDPFPMPFKLSVQHSPGMNADMMLPTSHTCFFTLDLPQYSSKDVMRQKVLYAIHNSVAIGESVFLFAFESIDVTLCLTIPRLMNFPSIPLKI